MTRLAVSFCAALLCSPLAALADTVTEPAFACVEADDAWALIRLIDKKHSQAAAQFFASRAMAEACRFLDAGEVVATVATAGSDLVKVQPARGGRALWTIHEAIRP
jgi:hypothetical protein